jgi:hypothetical protein
MKKKMFLPQAVSAEINLQPNSFSRSQILDGFFTTSNVDFSRIFFDIYSLRLRASAFLIFYRHAAKTLRFLK